MKNKEKPVRVQFPKDAEAGEIIKGIRAVQDEWARKNPEKARRLYPKRYDEKGQVIKQ